MIASEKGVVLGKRIRVQSLLKEYQGSTLKSTLSPIVYRELSSTHSTDLVCLQSVVITSALFIFNKISVFAIVHTF